MQTNEIFLLAGEVSAQIAAGFAKGPRAGDTTDSSADTEKLAAARACAPFADFVQEPWWDVAVPRDTSHHDAVQDHAVNTAAAGAGSLPDTLRALCEESSALLRSALALALGPLPAPLELALGTERFARVVGMFEQNNVGIRAPSPIPGVVRELLAEGGEGCRVRRDDDDDDDSARREVLREAAGLVLQITEEQDCAGGDVGRDGVVGEGHDHDDGRGCCAPPAVGVSEDGERLVQTAGKTDSAPPAARGGGESAADGDEVDILAVLRSAVDGGGDGDEVDSREDLFAPLDGTALYSLVCCMNHSCRPNCVVRYPGRRQKGGKHSGSGSGGIADPLVAEVVLLEDVSAGEELTQSYVTREMSLTERREALEDYGFLCACPRCLEDEQKTAALS